MNGYEKFFTCKVCQGTLFEKNYTFSVSFKEVNFTNDLIYDEHGITEYGCKQCGEIYTKEEIRKTIKDVIRKYKENYWENEIREDK